MTNRKDRRAEKATAPTVAEIQAIQNVSGTAECCANCACAAERTLLDKNRVARGFEPMPADELSCMLNPGGGIGMKVWGWCAQWRGRAP